MSNIFFTSDHHFGHYNIIHHANRPFKNCKDMHDVLIDNWNKVVSINDMVYHLGDFNPWNDPSPFIPKLNGNIILIMGNHDKKKHLDKFYKWYNNLEMMIGSYKCLLNHRPIYPKEHKDPHGDNDTTIQNPEQYDFIVHGHTHHNIKWGIKNNFNVCVEAHNYCPVSIEFVIGEFDRYKQCFH